MPSSHGHGGGEDPDFVPSVPFAAAEQRRWLRKGELTWGGNAVE